VFDPAPADVDPGDATGFADSGPPGLSMLTLRWWIIAGAAVVIGAGAWAAARLSAPREPTLAGRYVPPDVGPPVADPYDHVLEVTGVLNVCCSPGCPPGVAERAGVSWRLLSTAPTGTQVAAPLQGRVCQQDTWGKPEQLCTEPFDLVEGIVERTPPEHLVVEATAPGNDAPAGTWSVVHIELMVGARRTPTSLIPAMASRAQATYYVQTPSAP
jgi:hypothetical protein